MSEAEETIGGDLPSGKREFKNGDVCPWDKDLVLWGYKGDDPWWVDWSTYWSMAKRHKGLVRQRRRRNGIVKRGML
jgi:hypothetical protein